MDRKAPLDMADDDYNDDFDAPAESDISYSEEMSRQAVGKLFAKGGRADTGRGASSSAPNSAPRRSEAADSGFVKGFGRDSADDGAPDGSISMREQPREIRVVDRSKTRQAGASTRVPRSDAQAEAHQLAGGRNTTRRPALESPTGRRPEAGATTGRTPEMGQRTALVPDVASATGRRPDVASATGRRPDVASATGRRPDVASATGRRPDVASATGRRPDVASATGRRPDVASAYDSDYGTPPVESLSNNRTSRRAGAETQSIAGRQGRQSADEATSLDLEGFRQRYNPDEVISPPRVKNRPVRNSQSGGARKDRVRISDGDLETISSFRMVLIGGVILIVGLIGFLFYRVAALENDRSMLEEQVEILTRDREENSRLHGQLENLNRQLEDIAKTAQEYREIFEKLDIDPDRPIEDQLAPNSDGSFTVPNFTAPGQSARPTLPHDHRIVLGDNLASIARFYFPQFDHDDRTARNFVIDHIVRDNTPPINPNNINNIQAGWVLRINPIQIDQDSTDVDD